LEGVLVGKEQICYVVRVSTKIAFEFMEINFRFRMEEIHLPPCPNPYLSH
jgi:hypothetical protein